MTFDPFSLTGLLALALLFCGIGFGIGLIAVANYDYEEDFGQTCSKSTHLFQLDPQKEINYCFCEKESWKTNANNLVMIKS